MTLTKITTALMIGAWLGIPTVMLFGLGPNMGSWIWVGFCTTLWLLAIAVDKN